MKHGNGTNRWIMGLASALALLWMVGTGDQAHGQDRPHGPDARQRRPQRGSRPQHGDRDGRPREHQGGGYWGRQIFQPSEEDRGPLREGEEQELRDFLSSELPRLHRLLEHVEDRSPRAFQRSLHRLLPRLRQLRRIHQRDPELAKLIGQHAEHLFRAGMLRRAWHHADADARPDLEHRVRGEIAATVRVESAVLDHWANHLEATRAERIAQRVAALTADDADLASEPQPVRKLVDELRLADDAARRLELEAELAQIVGQQLEHEIAGLRARAKAMKAGAREEVDRHMQHWLEGPPARRRGP